MSWVALCSNSLIANVRALPVDQDLKWKELDKAIDHINGLLTIIEKSDMEICHLNFKLPLHEINCILRCTTAPELETIFVMDIILLD